MTDFLIAAGVGIFAALSMIWAYVSITKRWVCPLMADSLLNGAVLFGAISIILLSDRLQLVTAENRTSINMIFTFTALIVQVQILWVHQLYHKMMGPEEPK